MQGCPSGIQESIRNYFDYFPAGPTEAAWTLHLSSIGRAAIEPGSAYPPPRHPEDHAFTWERGRVLPALQLVAIRSGSGELEFRGQRHRLSPGSVMLLPPRVWHRYRPDRRTGWSEQWVELRGPAIESWLASGMLDIPPVRIPRQDQFWSHFEAVHRVCSQRGIGHRAAGAGLAMSLVARVVARAGLAEGRSPGRTAEIARAARELLARGGTVHDAAAQLGVSYPTLHRQFMRATGMSPKRYASELRLAQAEYFLSSGSLSVKEIAARLGYHSASHFSLEFKRRRGTSPSRWREG